jgi:hypothetical protein
LVYVSFFKVMTKERICYMNYSPKKIARRVILFLTLLLLVSGLTLIRSHAEQSIFPSFTDMSGSNASNSSVEEKVHQYKDKQKKNYSGVGANTINTRSGLNSLRSEKLSQLFVELATGGVFTGSEVSVLSSFVSGNEITSLEADTLISRALYQKYIAQSELSIEQDDLLYRYDREVEKPMTSTEAKTYLRSTKPVKEVEPNDSPSQVKEEKGLFISGQIFPSDADLFSFSAEAGDIVALSIRTKHKKEESVLDAKLSLLDSKGSPIAPTFIGSSSQFKIFQVSKDGSYYVKVSGNSEPGAVSFSRKYLLAIDIVGNSNRHSESLIKPNAVLPAVAIMGAPGSTFWNDEIREKLLATGLFSKVDVFFIASVTPTLEQMKAYKAILVYNDRSIINPSIFGDNLANYLDAGGGVVTAVFATASIPIGGRFGTSGSDYYAIRPTSQQQGTREFIGQILVQGHPILNGVTSFDGGSSSYRPTSTNLHPAATLVARWTGNGTVPLIATRVINGVNRVDLGFFPPSTDSRSDFWNAATNGIRLIANSLLFTVGSNNSAPIANNQSVTTNEDEAANITLSASDSNGDTLTYSIVSEPSHGTLSGTAPNLVYTPNANFNGTDSFTFKANDGQVDSNAATVSITIKKVNDPPAAASDNYMTDEDNHLNVSVPGVLGNDTDIENEALSAVKVSDPSNGILNFNSDGSFTYTPNVNFNGSDSFTYKARDGSADSSIATVLITINPINDAPTANAGGPYSVLEGGSVSVTANGNDVDGDSLTFAWDLDNNLSFETPGKTVTFSAADLDGPSKLTIKVRVTDGTLSGTAEATVQVVNVAPTLNPLALTADSILEGGSVTLTGSFIDPGVADLHVVVINWGDGSSETVMNLQAGFYTFNAIHLFLDDNPTETSSDTYKITVTVTDDDSGMKGSEIFILVNNAAPVISSITGPLEPLALGSSANITVNFTDVGSQDTHTYKITWDDGQVETLPVNGSGSGSATAFHTFAATGVYSVLIQIIDDDGGVVDSKFDYVVIYDQNGGFVTGGGWIASSAGAFTDIPALTGKASFGFVSKYQKGATVPTGNTEFQFIAGNFNFKSSAYEFLVVSGHKAQYKGTGTINGTGNYSFIVTVTDGQQPGGGGVDKFRIKIVDKNSNKVVYDNVRGESDDIDSASPQAISGGSIVIHESGK